MSSRTQPEGRGPNLSLVQYFVTVQLIGLVGFIIILLTTSLSPTLRKQRQATWFNFCVAWLFYCVSYTLLTFAGQQSGPQPSHGICLAQAALVYAAPTLTASTSLALAVQLWLNLTCLVHQCNVTVSRIRTFALVTVPYLIYSAVFANALFMGISQPQIVTRAESDIYCILDSGIPGKVSAGIVAFGMVGTIILEGVISIFLYRNQRAFKRGNVDHPEIFTMIVRIVIYTVFGFLSIIMCLFFFSETYSPVPNTFIGLLPVVAVILFGSQMDLVRVWMFWKSKEIHLLESIPSPIVANTDLEKSSDFRSFNQIS